MKEFVLQLLLSGRLSPEVVAAVLVWVWRCAVDAVMAFPRGPGVEFVLEERAPDPCWQQISRGREFKGGGV